MCPFTPKVLRAKERTPTPHSSIVFTLDCHARIHGLIYDGRLRACPSYLLGLMYGCRVNVRS
jgi:hypothetical protein